MGFSRKERAASVETITKKLKNFKKTDMPLDNWLNKEDPDAITNAQENGLPIDKYKEQYNKVKFNSEFKPEK